MPDPTCPRAIGATDDGKRLQVCGAPLPCAEHSAPVMDVWKPSGMKIVITEQLVTDGIVTPIDVCDAYEDDGRTRRCARCGWRRSTHDTGETTTASGTDAGAR